MNGASHDLESRAKNQGWKIIHRELLGKYAHQALPIKNKEATVAVASLLGAPEKENPDTGSRAFSFSDMPAINHSSVGTMPTEDIGTESY
ncbi:MAG TPA: hypothetical protein VLA64_03505 [Azonexus sp.]|nr:hypothetical protein [Azonexus sp.]